MTTIFGNSIVAVRHTCPRAILLAMITMRRVSFCFLYEYGAPLVGPFTITSPNNLVYQSTLQIKNGMDQNRIFIMQLITYKDALQSQVLRTTASVQYCSFAFISSQISIWSFVCGDVCCSLMKMSSSENFSWHALWVISNTIRLQSGKVEKIQKKIQKNY